MFEFLEYTPTPQDKHLGIATIKAYGKIILRYKVVSGKDGQGFFLSPASYKMGVDAMGKDVYEKCFMIDSIYENKLLEDCIRAHVNPYASNSVFNQAASFNNAQPSVNIATQLTNANSGHHNANLQKPVFGQNQPQEVGTYFQKADDMPF